MQNDRESLAKIKAKYESNSSITDQKKAKPKQKPVVTAKVEVHKPSLGRRISETFFEGQTLKQVSDYVIFDVLVPAVRDTFVNMVKGGLDTLFYGGSRNRGGAPFVRQGGQTYVSYESRVNGQVTNYDQRNQSYRDRASHNFDGLVIHSRPEAENVLRHMCMAIEEFNVVSVADFYDLINVPSEHTDNNYGWHSLTNAYVDRARGGGYIIRLPKPIRID